MAKRFFIKNPDLHPGREQSLAKDFFLVDIEHNHLANVLRLKVGDKIIIVCGDEFDYHYKITDIRKNSTKVEFSKRVENMCNPKSQLTVYISLIKFDNLVTALTKLSEIGVSDVVLFSSDYSNVPAKSVNMQKLEKILEQSCKQCERSIPIKLCGVISFGEVLKDLPKNTIFADEAQRFIAQPHRNSSPQDIINLAEAIVIGPEGGFSDRERVELGKIAKSISLGPRILRTETAAIVASTLVLASKGEF